MGFDLSAQWKKVLPKKGYAENYLHFLQLETVLARNLSGVARPSVCARENADRALKKAISAVAPEGNVNLDVVLRLYEVTSKYGSKIPIFLEFTSEVEDLLSKSLKE